MEARLPRAALHAERQERLSARAAHAHLRTEVQALCRLLAVEPGGWRRWGGGGGWRCFFLLLRAMTRGGGDGPGGGKRIRSFRDVQNAHRR